jgi:hypothetical protein
MAHEKKCSERKEEAIVLTNSFAEHRVLWRHTFSVLFISMEGRGDKFCDSDSFKR